MQHCTPSNDSITHIYIENCLHAFRQALEPAHLEELCADGRAMTLRFMRMIDFLNSLQSSGYAVWTAYSRRVQS
jgi:hypothetical protein